MRKPVSIIFFVVYLAAVFQLEQLVKIPVLFQHYTEHIRMEGKISFSDFLREHYTEDDPSDADYARDMQLPFKRCSHHFFMLMTAAAPKSAIEIIETNTGDCSNYHSPLNDSRLFHPFAGGIFQPPRGI